MKNLGFFALLLIAFAACKPGNKAPDVSDIPVEVKLQRFDKEFFSINPANLDQELSKLNASYPDFFPAYLINVLGIPPSDTAAVSAIAMFLNSYRPIYDSANVLAEKHLPQTINDIKYSLQLWKHYLPDYKIDSPFVVTTFIGPMDAFEPFALGDYGDVRTRNGVGIALQFHLGAFASVYQQGMQSNVFYDYQVRRFTPEMMPVNAIKNIILDAFPAPAAASSLVDEMIEKGKRLYLLEKLLPNTPDYLQLGYTEKQLAGCYENEALIWNYFVKNDLLYSKDMLIMQNYIKDGPKTAELGDGAPGFIGLFVGRQLVRSYMKAHADLQLEQLMKTSNQEILNGAGYKP